ncbi:DUF2381 family protein [Myxococcus sp. K15C18031901]|nr:DUF2381 family protein [Myxococcus dinghuensis]
MAAVAGEAALEPKMRKRHITLAADTPERTHVVAVAGDTATVLLFDSPLVPSSVEVGASRERFERLEVTERALVLMPREDLAPRERVLVSVRFADGLMPQRLQLALVSDPATLDLQLRVSRTPLAPEALQQRVLDLARRCEETGGFGAVLHTQDLGGALTQGSFIVESFDGVATLQPQVSGGRVFRSTSFAALEVHLTQPSDAAPWRLERIELEHRGARLRIHPLQEEVPMHRPRAAGRILLEVPAPEALADGAQLVLHLFDGETSRHVTVRGRVEVSTR